ncbi:riboflavin synthase [soil metagenome]
MFTGIVEELGSVTDLGGHRLVVGCERVLDGSEIGASIAVNGVCLTVVERGRRSLAFDLSDETIARTSLRRLAEGAAVNLERPVTLASRLGGHVVQGHVDGVGSVHAVDPDDGGGARVRVRLPRELRRYTIEKGSLALDGVSLTVAELHDDGVTVALIPHTLAATTMGSIAPGDPVNIEVDMIARYVERLVAPTQGVAATDATDIHQGAER